ncbi:MAG: hypothetical protein PHT24_03150 [Endomicrobiaceae bacterium]|jgi:hypothetical protein|nr:hypothetical protein [Endomicrobiaceae bacterium]MDD4166765.1 hypothetical protein [Endomicrobiaceae bacterium]
MIKKIALSLAFLLCFMSSVFARIPIQIESFVKGVDITGPDKEKKRFFDIESIPNILYSSNIAAYGGVVNLSVFGADIILKNSQCIYISKDPISKGIRISKIENSIDCPVIVDLPVIISIGEAMTILLDYNSVISFKQKDDNVYEFNVVFGRVNVKQNGQNKQLSEGEKFEYEIVQGDNENAI